MVKIERMIKCVPEAKKDLTMFPTASIIFHVSDADRNMAGGDFVSVRAARCKKCHRRLLNAEAIAAGYGPVCFRSLFGKPLTAGRHAKREAVKIAKPRKAAGHQISVFEIEEASHVIDDGQEPR